MNGAKMWTVLQHDGPNHLGLWLRGKPLTADEQRTARQLTLQNYSAAAAAAAAAAGIHEHPASCLWRFCEFLLRKLSRTYFI